MKTKTTKTQSKSYKQMRLSMQNAVAGTRSGDVGVRMRCGDSADVLAGVDSNVFDCMVTDPPAGVMAIGKKTAWDHDHGGRDKWILDMASVFRQAHRTLKPGAYGLVWTLPKTMHWTMTALEDAGFEIVDTVSHVFPRSLIKGMDASKAIDSYLGLPRKVVGLNKNARAANTDGAGFVYNSSKYDTRSEYEVSRQWEGWRSNLKPAQEQWVLVRKQFQGNVAENILAYDVGGVRVGVKNVDKIQSNVVISHDVGCSKDKCVRSCPCRILRKQNPNFDKYFKSLYQPNQGVIVDDKIGRKERGSNRHPTVKTQALMRFLIKLVCPAKGIVLDPFAGSGSTGVACIGLGRGFYGVEKEREHWVTAVGRITTACT